MALIKCPECGKEISNMAEECPYCGISMEDIQARLQRIEAEDEVLIEEDNNIALLQQEKVDQQKSNNNQSTTFPKKRKRIIVGIAALILLITVGVLVSIIISNFQRTKEKEQLLKEYKQFVTVTVNDSSDYDFDRWASTLDKSNLFQYKLKKYKLTDEERSDITRLVENLMNHRIEMCRKTADKVVSSLGRKCDVVAVVLDSQTRKVFYIQEVDDEIFDHNKLVVYDLDSKENTKLVDGRSDGYITNGKLIKDRLFYMSAFQLNYVNIRDNSLHENIVSNINSYTPKGDELFVESIEDGEFSLSAQLSDEEYRTLKSDREKEKARKEDEERRRENDINDISWLYGKWYLNTNGISLFLYIDKDKLTYGDIDCGVSKAIWDGDYTLYMNRIEILGETMFKVDLGERKIYTLNGKPWVKASSSSSQSSYSSGGSTRTTTFNTSSDVMAYVSNRFRNSTGNVITVKYNGIYCNGNPITNAVRVVRFNGSHATLSATSPYASGTLYFSVDASRGTITENSGDVFYIQ